MREPYNESSSERSPRDASAVREVRRYPNRRLYDSRSRAYVTVQQIRSWIEAGERVRVIDVATNADVTVAALSALLVELVEGLLSGPAGADVLHEAVRRRTLPLVAPPPPSAHPESVDDRSLQARIEELERRVTQLERR